MARSVPVRSGSVRSKVPDGIDALQFLKREHNGLKRLFTELRRTAPRAHRKRRELLDRIVTDLEVHARIEEDLFYPAITEVPYTRHMIEEARADHDAVREVVTELEALAPTDRAFPMKADELREIALAHILEEEDDVFPLASRLGSERLEDLGAALAARRRQLGEHRAVTARRSAAA
jgi:hemerythrin superfamily protein